MIHRDPDYVSYRNEHLRRPAEIRQSYRDALRALLDDKAALPHAEYRDKKSAIRREHRAASRAFREERRVFFREHKMPRYPIMADIFDVAEDDRAAPNGCTPFVQSVKVEYDVPYKTVKGETLVMDIYYPAAPAASPRPLVLDIPGGGWMIHNRPRRGGYARCFAEMGAVVAVIDHRLCPAIHFPDNLADCVDAYNYLVDNAERYQADARNITVTGDSSGGHLAACLGCAATSREYADKLGIAVPKTKPSGFVFVSAAFNFERMYRLPFTNTLMVRYVSGQLTRRAFRRWRYYRECNPQNYVSGDYPPCYNSGGMTDFLCLGEARHMAKILDGCGVENAVRVGKNPFRSDHCYVLRFPYATARRDALALYRWYLDRQAALGVDLSAGFAHVAYFLEHYEDALSARAD